MSITGSEFTIEAPHELGVVLSSVLAGGQVSVPLDANGFGVVPGVVVTPTVAGLYRVEGSAILQTQNGVTTTLDVGFSTSSSSVTWPATYPMSGTIQVAPSGGTAQSFALGWLDASTLPASVFLWVHVTPATASFTIAGKPEDLAVLALSSAFNKASTWLTAELVEGPPI